MLLTQLSELQERIALSKTELLDRSILLLCIGSTIAWALVAGKDLNWDQLNYHFYAGYSFVQDRLDQDFLAANAQSYFNPLPYVPFYWMVSRGWSSVAITCVLAITHSLNIALAFFITRRALPANNCHRNSLAFLGAALAFVSPVFLVEAGASFADVTTGTLALLAVLVLQAQDQDKPWWRDAALAAGVCVGCAAGLKLSNVIFAPAIAAMLLNTPAVTRSHLCKLLLLAVGGFFGVLVTHGYWSWRLWTEFKNPFFPMFNATFASPDYPALNHQHGRYLPDSLFDAVSLPFRMIALRSWIYIESVSPDLRFAAITVAMLVIIGIVTCRRVKVDASHHPGPAQPLIVFFLTAYAFWLITSGNGRYGIVISILAGPVTAVCVHAAFRAFRKEAQTWIPLCGLIAMQVFHLQNGQLHWGTGSWTQTWYDVSVPKKLQTTPYLYIAVGSESNSYIAPFLSPHSAFTNPIGQLSFDLDGPGGARLKNLLTKYEGRVRIISKLPPGAQTSEPAFHAWQSSANNMLSRFGLEIDPGDCELITTAGMSHELGNDYTGGDERRQLRTCKLRPAVEDESLKAERREVKELFESVVRWCPKLFKPTYTVVEKTPSGWFSTYADSDSTIRLDNGDLAVTQPHTSAVIALGNVADWKQNKHAVDCAKTPSRLWRIYNFGDS